MHSKNHTEAASRASGRFSIRRMMLLAGIVVVTSIVIVSFLNVRNLQQNRIGSQDFLEIEKGLYLIADMAPPALLPFEAYATVQFSASEPSSALAPYEAKLQELKQAQLAAVEKWGKEMQGSPAIDQAKWKDMHAGLAKRSADFWVLVDRSVMPAIRNADESAKRIALQQLDEQMKENVSFIRPVQSHIAESVHAYEKRSIAGSGNAMLLTTVLSVALCLFVGLLVLLGQATIVRALARLSGSMQQLSGGNLQADVPYEARRDEIGDMARSLAVFKSMARENSERARENEIVIKALGAGLESISGGDLTKQLDEPFPPALDVLRTYFNDAVRSLQQTISTVKMGTDGIKSGTEDIAQASDDLSRRTETQAANLEETAAAVAEITGKVKQTASGAIHARTVVESAKSEADRSGEVVRRAVGAMQQIESSSQRITQIISVIDEIAFQTNLLALNAGVEAARAGDAGRGFAVVASEVRALAQRSADAAREIKSLLSTSQDAVQQGVSLVAETGTSLKSIIDRVAEINGIVAEIASSAEQQASGLQEVNTAVDQMDQVTQQNASMVEETTAATRTLTQQSAELARMVARFTVAAAASIERHEASQRRAPPVSHRPAARAPLPLPASSRKQQASAAVAADDWQEF